MFSLRIVNCTAIRTCNKARRLCVHWPGVVINEERVQFGGERGEESEVNYIIAS